MKTPQKPTIVFLHGINGSNAWTTEIARNLPQYTAKFLELPAHGQSDLFVKDLDELHWWFEQKIGEVLQTENVAAIVCYSFSAFSCEPDLAQKLRQNCKIIFLCPVPNPSRFYYFVTRLTRYLSRSKLLIKLYNKVVPIWYYLMSNKSPGILVKLRAVAERDNVSFAKRRQQSEIAQILLTNPKIADPDLVLFGEKDKTAKQRNAATFRKVFPGAKIIGLKNLTHMAPIENAEIIAENINEFLQTK